MSVKCKHCGGIIDLDTLVCMMCAREYQLIQCIAEKRRKQRLKLNEGVYPFPYNKGVPRLPRGPQND